jgi:hypothetical protein
MYNLEQFHHPPGSSNVTRTALGGSRQSQHLSFPSFFLKFFRVNTTPPLFFILRLAITVTQKFHDFSNEETTDRIHFLILLETSIVISLEKNIFKLNKIIKRL